MPIETHLLNRTGFRHGPLNRHVDRVEAWSRLVLVVLFLAVALPLTWSVGSTVAREGAQQEATQRAERHPVTARLVDINPSPDAESLTLRMPVTAEWTEPDGSQHRGVVTVAPGKTVGSTQTIWTDAAGRPVPAPVAHSDTVASVAGAVFFVPLLIGGVTLGIGEVIRRRCDRLRYRQWACDWERVEPEWSRHH